MNPWKLYLDEIQRTTDTRREADERILAILAGKRATIYGKPVEFEIKWPEGPPMRMTEEQMRQYCAEQLALSRIRRAEVAT